MNAAMTNLSVSTFVVVALLLGNILLLAYVLHKVRRVHVMSFAIRNDIERVDRESNSVLFRQVQALDGLYRDLKLAHALPLLRKWAASPDFLSVVSRYALDRRPRAIVECGSGVSTVVLARCMQLNGAGHVFSLDHDPQFAEQTRRELERHGLGEWATVIDAAIKQHKLGDRTWGWYDIRGLPDGPIDMLVVDGPPMPLGPMIRYPVGPLLFPRLSATAVVALDDADRPDEQKAVARWVEEYPRLRAEKIDCEKGCAVLQQQGS
jgi:predicted O-methyltransferase YrrM